MRAVAKLTSAAAVRAAKPKIGNDGKLRPRWHSAGEGLFLVVDPSATRRWVLRYQVRGKRRDMGLGLYPAVSLSQARKAALEAREKIAIGIDPIDERKALRTSPKPTPTFGGIAALVIADAQAKSASAKTRYQWGRYLGPAYSGPLLDRPVHEITAIDVAKVLTLVWRTKPEVARKLYPAIRRVFERARVILRDEHGIPTPINPANWPDLKAMGFEPPQRLSKGHHPALPYDCMPAFMSDLRAREAIAARALEFLILTNVRTDAVLNAAWDEFDLGQAVWTVPLVNLKDRKYRKECFRLPLSPRAVEIVTEMQKGRVSRLVFPGRAHDKPLAHTAMLVLLKRMSSGDTKWIDPTRDRPITVHGFRAAFRTWAGEAATFPHDVIEQAMGHQVGTKADQAYNRGDAFKKRQALMQAWAQWCEPPSTDEKVTRLRQIIHGS